MFTVLELIMLDTDSVLDEFKCTFNSILRQ